MALNRLNSSLYLFLSLIVLIKPLLCDFNQFEIVKSPVAVCISGQSARWQPQHLLEGLIKPNNEQYYFIFFFNIQVDIGNKVDTVFNTDKSNSFSPSLLSTFTNEELISYLKGLYEINGNRVANLETHRFISKEELEKQFNVSSLDRITQHTDVQATILNMYSHQVNCVHQIIQYERKAGLIFEFIISTREDVYFFRPINISSMTSNLRRNITTFNSQNDCDILYKGCLNFWGFNMRFYVLTRETGIKFLGNRFSFYKYLYKINKTIENPERFELIEANALGLLGCPLSVERYPVTAVRHYYHGQMCFIWFEIDRCVPEEYHDFAKSHMCLEYRRNFFLNKIYTELPELLKSDFITGVGNISLYQPVKKIRKNLNVNLMRKYHSSQKRLINQDYIERAVKRKGGPLYLTEDPNFVQATWTVRDFN
jgi:hypothetical protein